MNYDHHTSVLTPIEIRLRSDAGRLMVLVEFFVEYHQRGHFTDIARTG